MRLAAQCYVGSMTKPTGWTNVALFAVAFCIVGIVTVFALFFAGCADNPPYLERDGFLRPYANWPCDGGKQ